jgi:hypothetical protein
MIILKCCVSTAANKEGRADVDEELRDLISLSEGTEQETKGGYESGRGGLYQVRPTLSYFVAWYFACNKKSTGNP